MRTLVTGGVKSGKSYQALALARAEFAPKKIFLATAEICDEEMAERVAKHRAERRLSGGNPGSAGTDEFETIEEPIRMDEAIGRLASLPGSSESPRGLVIDCLPMWVNNLMHYGREDEFEPILDAVLASWPADCIVVTNETGLGNIPFDEQTRRYNRLLAAANLRFAAASDRVILMVSGIPLRIK
jgi:adenosylcobinamide kinase/adenosylcobinamide-phosphate guanylyltransferase